MKTIQQFMTLLIFAAIACGCRNESKITNESNVQSAELQRDLEKSARKYIEKFLDPFTDHQELMESLRPTEEDYLAVFKEPLAKKAMLIYEQAWDAGEIDIEVNGRQTQIKLQGFSTDLIQDDFSQVDLPGGYREVSQHLHRGLVVFKFSVAKSGQSSGRTYNGLIRVNGHWRFFPDPWMLLDPDTLPQTSRIDDMDNPFETDPFDRRSPQRKSKRKMDSDGTRNGGIF